MKPFVFFLGVLAIYGLILVVVRFVLRFVPGYCCRCGRRAFQWVYGFDGRDRETWYCPRHNPFKRDVL